MSRWWAGASPRRRARRWAKRHRTSVTAAAVALLVTLAGTSAVLAVQTRANSRLTLANAALAVANQREEERFDLANQAIRTFHSGVSEDLLLKESRFKELRTRLLRGAAGFYTRLELLLTGQSDRRSRAALGAAYEELSDLTRKVGSNPEALAIETKAHAVWRGLAAEPGHDAKTDLAVARTLRAIGTLRGEAGETAEGLAATQDSGKLVEAAIALGDQSSAAQSLLGLINYSIASTLHRTGKLREAMVAYHQAIGVQRKLSRTDPSDIVNTKSLVRSLCNSGVLLSQTGKETEALTFYDEGRLILDRLITSNPDDHDCQSNLAWIDNARAVLLLHAGKQDEAMGAFERSLSIKQQLADANPNVTYLQSELAVSLLNIGGLLSETGKPVEAITASRRALAVFRALADANPTVPDFQSRLAVIHHNIGMVLEQTGKRDEAMASYQRAIEIERALVGANASIASYRNDLAETRRLMGLLLSKLGKPTQGVLALTAAQELWQRLGRRQSRRYPIQGQP